MWAREGTKSLADILKCSVKHFLSVMEVFLEILLLSSGPLNDALALARRASRVSA